MNYPVWDLPMGSGVLIAVVAVLHVFVSHFAVGGGLWLVVTEARARRTGDAQLRQFVKDHSRFFMLLTLVFGAISGVGIWATIGLISPQATSALIHAYVWGWAIEWVFFFVEIAAALVYYYGWERLDERTHEIVGWIYFVAAFLSLVVINGIITFMLTPGGWLENHDFWTGFFNPTYWPSAVVRTFAGIGIAGMFTLLSSAGLAKDSFRRRVTIWNAGWAVAGVLGVILGAQWYGHNIEIWRDNGALAGAIPVLPTVAMLFKAGLAATAILAVLPMVMPTGHRRSNAVALLLAGLLTMGAGEWLREAGRKPYTIHGYLYSTGMLVDDEERIAEEGMAVNTKWISPAAAGDEVRLGRDLYLAWCQPCHTKDGYNGLAPWLALWNRETVSDLLPRLQYLRALMPPWYGTEEENATLTAYLMTLKPGNTDGLAEAPWGDPDHGPEKAFAASCGLCHTPAGHMALGESFAGMDSGEIGDFVDESGDFIDEMPGFHGPGKQRELLVEYLTGLGEEALAAEEEGERIMIAFVANLIVPAPDILPVPAPTPVMHLLLLLTFFLHLLAMNTMLGGLLIALATAFRDRSSDLPATVVKSTPSLVATTVTLGVAPLLFLQTLMGQFFFTSSILMGWGWFSVVVVLIFAYYGSYLQAFRWAKRGTVQVGLLLATVIGFLWIAFMFSNNTSLMAAPAVWGDKYFADPRGLHLNLTDATLWPRYLHAVFGAAAVAGLVLGWWGSRRADADAGAAMYGTGLKTFILMTAVNVLAGLWYLMALPREAMLLFMGGSPLGSGILTAGLVLSLVALFLGWRAWKKGPATGLMPLTLVALVVMAVMVVMRDIARGGILAGLYKPEAFPVEPQWLNMGIFAVLFLGGIGVVMWMVRRLARAW